MKIIRIIALASFICFGLAIPAANASLLPFKTYTGTYGYSADGFGSTSQSGLISASVPSGSVVVAAYLYTSTTGLFSSAGGTISGTSVSYASLGSSSYITAGRADVTSIIKPLIDGGIGGVYNFMVTETNSGQDGEALVVVYQNSALQTSTIGILDGFSVSGGDTTTLNFAGPLNPVAPGFFADLAVGIGYSCCSQASTVKVNGTTITNNAGNYDDGKTLANGALITVGGYDDPYSPFMPSYNADHERYNIASYITAGDTSVVIKTNNPSGDDNIFLAIVHVSGKGSVNEAAPSADVPEPATFALFGLGLLGVVISRRKSAT